MKHCFLIILIACVFFSSGVGAQDPEALSEKIKEVQATLQQRQALLKEEKKREAQQLIAIQGIEKKMITTTKALEVLEDKIKTQEQTLQSLLEEERQLNNKMDKQQKRLGKQLKILYLLSKNSAVKMLINFENPDNIERLLHYHRYLKRYQVDNIKQALVELHALAENKAKTEALRGALGDLKTIKQQQVTELNLLKEEHLNILHAIQNTISAEERQLIKGQAQEKQLIEQLNIIQTALTTLPPPVPSLLSFERLKGRLQWPLGPHFDPKKHLNPSTSSVNTIIMRTEAGQAVHAVYHGRVVFAHDLKGFGLLLIIDHGGGYMSLYGHNQALYKNVGDSVQTGQLIGRVASMNESSEVGNSSLYFEIRKNGKPVNLVGWFK